MQTHIQILSVQLNAFSPGEPSHVTNTQIKKYITRILEVFTVLHSSHQPHPPQE